MLQPIYNLANNDGPNRNDETSMESPQLIISHDFASCFILLQREVNLRVVLIEKAFAEGTSIVLHSVNINLNFAG